MAGQNPDRECPGQRTSGDASSTGEHLVQELQPQRGSSGGEDGDIPQGSATRALLEGSSLPINAPRTPSASDARSQPISDTSIGRSCNTSNVLRQQKPPPFAHVPLPVFKSPHIPTNTERVQTRAKIAAREVQIQALEMNISYLGSTFGAESQEKFARLQPTIDYLNNQILGIQKEIADILNAFSAERQEAEAAVNAQLAELEARAHILKQENFRDASVLIKHRAADFPTFPSPGLHHRD